MHLKCNTSTKNVTFDHPISGKPHITALAETTGTFEDTDQLAKVLPSHGTRLRLLYVDFDGSRWWAPEREMDKAGIQAETTLNRVDVQFAIEELLKVLRLPLAA